MLVEVFTSRQVGQDVAFVRVRGSLWVVLDTACSGVERLRTEENMVTNMQVERVMDMVIVVVMTDVCSSQVIVQLIWLLLICKL